ncbi:hypothetical protein GKC29_23020 [Micromonospora sp. WMMC415]|uniref:hypothetical protein n=1 Tax=Micromonospora sp. WMMC415 TaxID=2675222 RepID=UPI0012B44F0A|nr:hypothetical protein [Micromonospora sp. WMMC415]QGN49409.1 hypothetical protein GKC29_23020 [Micromonospora sp. WMMC415]
MAARRARGARPAAGGSSARGWGRLSDGVVQALIGAAAVVLAAVIAGGVALHTARQQPPSGSEEASPSASTPPGPSVPAGGPGSGGPDPAATPTPSGSRIPTNLVLEPTSVRVGDTVTVTGTGFPALTEVTVSQGSDLTRNVVTRTDGSFVMTFVVTPGMCCGPKIVFAMAGSSRALQDVRIER